MKEVWVDIKGYEGRYQISNLGNVKRIEMIFLRHYNKYIKRGELLKLRTEKTGYVRVALGKNGKQKIYYVHRLVAEHFKEKKEVHTQVNHIDGDKENNHVGNVEWCTPSENTQHAYDTGLKIARTGTNSKLSRLTEEQITNIRKTYKPYKVSMEYLARKHGVSKQTICSVLHGKTYKEVTQ